MPPTTSRSRPKQLSRSGRSNQWRSRTEEDAYARDLRKLIRSYTEAAAEALPRYVQIAADGTQTVDLGGYQAELDRLLAALIATKGKKLISGHVEQSYKLGIQQAERAYSAACAAAQR